MGKIGLEFLNGQTWAKNESKMDKLGLKMDKIGLKMGKFGLKMGKIGLKNYPGYPECFILDNYLGLYPDILDKIIQDRNSTICGS